MKSQKKIQNVIDYFLRVLSKEYDTTIAKFEEVIANPEDCDEAFKQDWELGQELLRQQRISELEKLYSAFNWVLELPSDYSEFFDSVSKV